MVQNSKLKTQNSKLLFFSLDGLDGCGKSTQCRLLVEWLEQQGHAVTFCVDPGGTPLGARIREILLDRKQEMSVACETFLFMASRAQLVADVIRPALEQGRIVVSDRFLLANVVYQGHAGGLEPEQIREMGRIATDRLEPVLTLVLDVPVETAQARKQGSADRLESRDRDFHQRVRDGFRAEARQAPERIRLIDANGSIEQIHAHIVEEVERVLAARSGT
jgi:dTMP kinase